MPRYINEDEFVAWAKKCYCSDCNNDNGLRCRVCWIDDAIDLVEEAPEADVAPRSEVERLYYNLQAVLEEIEDSCVANFGNSRIFIPEMFAELKKKYTEGEDPK